MRSIPQTKLKEVTFIGRNRTPLSLLCRFLDFSSIESIIVGEVDIQSSIPSQMTDPFPENGCNLKKLDLGTRNLTAPKMETLLTRASSVSELKCALPDPGRWKSIRLRPIVGMSHFSPFSTVEPFWPLRATLVKLELNDHNAAYECRHRYDTIRMDFSSFTELKELILPACCFFRRSPAVPRGGVQRLIPPSLECLKVRSIVATPQSRFFVTTPPSRSLIISCCGGHR